MKVKQVAYKGEKALIIYVTKDESKDNIIKTKIIKYKEMYSSIAVFISGGKNMEDVIEAIVQEKLK
ncbi:hypothetical protein [Clostridium felsineum]|uniref:hypothetical protein n=1 Tax=Clostridium felsineum TaxID=36839 RepID=UPI00098C538B|nr:hypothetical protein [Clostridium felsineum]URZ01020.1 hypothetical protein CLAUR_010080 [Clostridium felsineum]